jgi:hypothetical protein
MGAAQFVVAVRRAEQPAGGLRVRCVRVRNEARAGARLRSSN